MANCQGRVQLNEARRYINIKEVSGKIHVLSLENKTRFKVQYRPILFRLSYPSPPPFLTLFGGGTLRTLWLCGNISLSSWDILQSNTSRRIQRIRIVHLGIRRVVNLQWIQELQWSVQGNMAASLANSTHSRTSRLSISAHYELLDPAELPETAGESFIMNYDYISDRNTRAFASPSQKMLVALPQLHKIVISPSSPEIVQYTAEILHSPCQLHGIKIKVFISWVTQMVQVIR